MFLACSLKGQKRGYRNQKRGHRKDDSYLSKFESLKSLLHSDRAGSLCMKHCTRQWCWWWLRQAIEESGPINVRQPGGDDLAWTMPVYIKWLERTESAWMSEIAKCKAEHSNSFLKMCLRTIWIIILVRKRDCTVMTAFWEMYKSNIKIYCKSRHVPSGCYPTKPDRGWHTCTA